MRGMHDLGGVDGFGRVQLQRAQPAYKQAWHLKAHALSALARRLGVYNMDEYRHAIERMEPRQYLGASYYERVLTACATLCVEKGFITPESLQSADGSEFPLALPPRSGRFNAATRPRRAVGDAVVTRDEQVQGHHRLPGYAMGKAGVIVGISPVCHFPDAAAHGLAAEGECTYDVRFTAQVLWGEGSEGASVTLAVFESYLL